MYDKIFSQKNMYCKQWEFYILNYEFKNYIIRVLRYKIDLK